MPALYALWLDHVLGDGLPVVERDLGARGLRERRTRTRCRTTHRRASCSGTERPRPGARGPARTPAYDIGPGLVLGGDVERARAVVGTHRDPEPRARHGDVCGGRVGDLALVARRAEQRDEVGVLGRREIGLARRDLLLRLRRPLVVVVAVGRLAVGAFGVGAPAALPRGRSSPSSVSSVASATRVFFLRGRSSSRSSTFGALAPIILRVSITRSEPPAGSGAPSMYARTPSSSSDSLLRLSSDSPWRRRAPRPCRAPARSRPRGSRR